MKTQPIDLNESVLPERSIGSYPESRPPSPSSSFSERLREFDWPMALGLAALSVALVLVVWLRPKGSQEPAEERPVATLLESGRTTSDEVLQEVVVGDSKVGRSVDSGSLSVVGRASEGVSQEDVSWFGGVDRVPLADPRPRTAVPDLRDESPHAAEPSSGRAVDSEESFEPLPASNYFEEVTELVAEARSAIAAGDWDRSIAAAERARERGPQSSAALEVSAEILAASRSAAVLAQREAESSGASTVSPEAFGDAVDRLVDGNRESGTSPLLAARSYREAADLFRRSGEKARLRGLRMALDEFAAAHELLDLDRLVVLWPSLTEDFYEVMANSFAAARSIEIEIDDCRMSLNREGGAADCRVSQDYVPLRGSRHSVSSRRRFDLVRQGSRWQVNGVYSAAP